MNEMDFTKLEGIIGFTFKDKGLLRDACTHRSYLNENKACDWSHNERLEFLGDAVLELVITDYLFQKYPTKSEGELTSFRASLVNANILSRIAGDMGLGDFILLSKGEAKDTGKARQYILANAFEAVIGALYLDGKYEAAHEFIDKLIFHEIDEIVEKGLWKDPKSFFQEIAQERTSITPVYTVLKEEGPDHDKIFTIGVYLGDELVEQGEGKSKQEAEQDAAAKALAKKNWNNTNT